MAAVPAATRLTETHRLAQARIGSQTVAQLMQVWPLLDPTDLDATTERWLSASRAIVQSQRRTSAALAAQYVKAFRALELGTLDGFVPAAAAALPDDQLITSLVVTGPVKVKQGLTTGLTLDRALEAGLAGSSGAGDRHALNGGRSVIGNTTSSDTRCIGYQRVTSGKPCAFCALLASRGPVYFSGSFGDSDTRFVGPGTAKTHDHCRCSSEPIYRDTDDVRTRQSQRFDDIYQQASKDLRAELSAGTRQPGPNDLLNAFRRAYEGQ